MTTTRRILLAVALLALVLITVGVVYFWPEIWRYGPVGMTRPLPAASTRPATWAQPVACPGVENFFQVSPALFRGKRPAKEGLRELEKRGIKTVVNLKLTAADDVSGTRLEAIRIPMESWRAEEAEVVEFLRIAVDPARQPVFVHCEHGADRTGTMCAIYRIAVQGWDKEQALREMTQGGFGFHPMWDRLVEYVRNLDVESIRRQALSAGPPP